MRSAATAGPGIGRRLIGLAGAVALAAGCASVPDGGTRSAAGGVLFRLRAPGAERVAVVGSFNGWDATRHPMQGPDGEGLFELFVPTGDRRIEYQFSVDGVRRPDPAAPLSVDDGFGGRNSVILRP